MPDLRTASRSVCPSKPISARFGKINEMIEEFALPVQQASTVVGSRQKSFGDVKSHQKPAFLFVFGFDVAVFVVAE